MAGRNKLVIITWRKKETKKEWGKVKRGERKISGKKERMKRKENYYLNEMKEEIKEIKERRADGEKSEMKTKE